MLYFINQNREIEEQSANSVPEVLNHLYDQVTLYGDEISSRTGITYEIFGSRFTLYPEEIAHLEKYCKTQTSAPFRRPILNNKRITTDEYCNSLMFGTPLDVFQSKPSTAYADALTKIDQLTSQLKADPLSRQAVCVIGNETCFTSFQLMIRNNKLHVLLNARSINLADCLPMDILFWSRNLLIPAAKNLGLEQGALHFNVGSLHVPTGAK